MQGDALLDHLPDKATVHSKLAKPCTHYSSDSHAVAIHETVNYQPCTCIYTDNIATPLDENSYIAIAAHDGGYVGNHSAWMASWL